METPKLIVQVISQTSRYAYDDADFYFTGGGNGPYYGLRWQNDDEAHSLFYLQALLNSRLLDFYLYRISSPFRGGYWSYGKRFIEQLPIRVINFSDPAEKEHHRQVVRLVDYLLFLKTNISEGASRDQLMVNYFEQVIDALVYELYLPDEIHTAGRQFFAPLIAEQLPALDEVKGDKLAALRRIFERLYDRHHVIRKNIFFLDTIESVRIIEGKA